LRVLLLLLTLFAIGFPVWYTWPYRSRTPHYPIIAGKPDPTKAPTGETSSQMKRVLGGKPVKHGKTVIVNGPYERTYTYDNNVLHGEYIEQLNGRVRITGRYERGEKHGEWQLHFGEGIVRQQWSAGKLHGPLRIEDRNGPSQEFVYLDGILIERDGEPVEFPLFARMAEGEAQLGPGARALNDTTQLEFVMVPLIDVVAYLRDFHETAIYVHPSVFDSADPKEGPLVTSSLRGVNLATALTVVADDLGLTCDYRYGAPWFTTRADAEDWTDTTGVTEIAPPANSPLQQQWETRIVAQANKQPLDVLIHNLLRPLGIPCDTSAIQSLDPNKPKYLVSINERRQPLKNLLGLILTNSECRCELKGQALVFSPQHREEIPDAKATSDATKK